MVLIYRTEKKVINEYLLENGVIVFKYVASFSKRLVLFQPGLVLLLFRDFVGLGWSSQRHQRL